MMQLTADKVRKFAVIGLLAVGAFLRFYQLDQYPLGVHQDELSNIYDGYSLAQTGADRFGDVKRFFRRREIHITNMTDDETAVDFTGTASLTPGNPAAEKIL